MANRRPPYQRPLAPRNRAEDRQGVRPARRPRGIIVTGATSVGEVGAERAPERSRARGLHVEMTSTTRLATAVIIFFSGFAALVYQVVWQRVLTQEIGVDTVSVAFIVTIFMIGLGFGALAGGRWTRRGRNLATSYAAIELLIGLGGVVSVPLLRSANHWLALVPAVARRATRDIDEAGHVFGQVLFWFIVGNVIGTFLTAIELFERFGAVGRCSSRWGWPRWRS